MNETKIMHIVKRRGGTGIRKTQEHQNSGQPWLCGSMRTVRRTGVSALLDARGRRRPLPTT